MQPIKLEIFLDDKTLAGMRSVEGNVAAMETVAKQMIDRLKLQLKELEAQYKVLQKQGLAGDRELADIQAMQGAIGGLKDQLKELQKIKQQTNETPVMGDDPAPKLNSVKMSMAQIARELPAIAMGPQMFFLAISNNIPMFTDAIGNARKEYERMTAAGQKATPVWRQVLKSLFSWQTAMATAITLTVVYGKEIGEWVKGLFKAKDAILELSSAENEMALARRKASESIKKEQVELDVLYSKLKSTTTSTKERIAAANEWMKRHPEYANILNGENVNIDKLGTAYKALSKEIYATAVARHYADKAAELSVKREKEEIKRLNQKLTIAKAEQEYERLIAEHNKKEEQGFGTATAKLEAKNKIELARKNIEVQKKIYNDLIENVNNYDKNITAISNHIQAADLFPQPKKDTYNYWKQQQERAEGVLKEIKSSVKKTLDDAAKDGKDLFSLGIDKSAVETYKKAVSEMNEAKKQLKVYDDKEKDKKPTGKTPTDYQNELSDARLRARQKVEAARIAILSEGYEKRKAIANKEYKETLAAIDKEERDTLAKQEKSKKAGNKVTPEETQQVKDDAALQRLLAREKYAKDYTEIEVDWMTQSVQAWVDYNKKYGTQQQKKLAIAQEYAMKIAKAETPLKKEALKREMKEEFQALDFSNLKTEINWEMVFGNLSALTGKQLQEVKRQLLAFRNSPEFKQSSSPEQIKVIEDAINSINTAMVDKGGLFGGLADSMAEYKLAVEEVVKAQEELNKALEKGDDAALEKAKENLNNANGRKSSAQGHVDKSKDKAIENINFISGAMIKLSEGRASLAEMGEIAEKLVNTLSESETKLGGVVGIIMSVFSSIAEKGVDGFIGGIVQSLGRTAEKAWGQLANSVTFGIFDIGGADYDDYNELATQYSKLSAIWDELIDKKREYINESYGDEVSKVGQETLDIIAKAQLAQQALAQARAKAGSGTGSHSIAYRQNKGLEGYAPELYKYISQNGNYDDITNALLGASAEQLKIVQEKMPELWARLDDEFRGHLENIISGAEQAKEVLEQMKEQLTQVSFDSVHGNFIETLMDMDASAEDFAKDFEGYMQRAILSTMMGEKYKDKLRAWYDSFAKANDDKEGITKEEMNQSKEDWDAIVKDALAERDKLKELFGWKGDSETSSQSGRSGTISTMTQEQGTKLEGLFTSLQNHTSAMLRLLEELGKGREADHELFVQIAENTAYCRLLEDIYELMVRQDRDGAPVKMKG